MQGAGSDEERVRLLSEQLAQKEAEAAELSRAVDSLERENSSLEAQVRTARKQGGVSRASFLLATGAV